MITYSLAYTYTDHRRIIVSLARLDSLPKRHSGCMIRVTDSQTCHGAAHSVATRHMAMAMAVIMAVIMAMIMAVATTAGALMAA